MTQKLNNQIFVHKNVKCIEADYIIEKYSNNATVNEQLASDISSEIIYMMFMKMKIGCRLPYSNWFMDEIFIKNNTSADVLSLG
jgi:hypothetical protein